MRELDFSDLFEWLGELLPGLGMSLLLLLGLLAVGIPLGIALGLLSGGRVAVLRWIVIGLVEVGRGVPLLVMLYLFYYGLPTAGIILEALPTAIVACGVSFAAYTAEVFRASVDSVDVGQWEASAALGLHQRVAFTRIIAPQAIRVVVPPLLGWTISFFQATSLAFVITVPELMSRAYSLAAANFRYMEILLVVGAIYAVICIPASRIVALLESRQFAGSSRT